MVVAGCREDFDQIVAYLYKRNVESSAAEVVYHYFLSLAVVKAVRESGGRRLVYYPEDV